MVTLLRHEDVRHFRGMLRKADNAFVADHRLAKGALEAVRLGAVVVGLQPGCWLQELESCGMRACCMLLSRPTTVCARRCATTWTRRSR